MSSAQHRTTGVVFGTAETGRRFNKLNKFFFQRSKLLDEYVEVHPHIIRAIVFSESETLQGSKKRKSSDNEFCEISKSNLSRKLFDEVEEWAR